MIGEKSFERFSTIDLGIGWIVFVVGYVWFEPFNFVMGLGLGQIICGFTSLLVMRLKKQK